MGARPLVLVVDNYDSFVYNVVQYVGELGAEVLVRRNDDVEVSAIESREFSGVIISPGPGHPRDAGRCLEVIGAAATERVPLLGICLGHQALAEYFGGDVVRAPELFHGRASLVEHDGAGVFAGLSQPLTVGRYHSLVVDETTLPDELVISARSHGLVMGLRHRSLDLEGVQFHPESVLTQDGYLLLANWLARCGVDDATTKAATLSRRADLSRAALPQPVH